MWYSSDIFHYMFNAEFVSLISLKVPSGKGNLSHGFDFLWLLVVHIKKWKKTGIDCTGSTDCCSSLKVKEEALLNVSWNSGESPADRKRPSPKKIQLNLYSREGGGRNVITEGEGKFWEFGGFISLPNTGFRVPYVTLPTGLLNLQE